jgi:pimeloyl-ACP methyl ester carboxylesterase
VLGEPPILPLLISNPDNLLAVLSLLFRNFPAGKSFIRFGMKSMKPAQQAFWQGDLEAGVHLFANGVLGESGFEQLPPQEKAAVMDNASALKAELLGPGFPEFPKAAAEKLNIPTLLVYGERSPYFFHAISDKLFRILPKVEKVIIPNASHRIHADNATVYNQKVLAFLARYN